jgi:probable O-glycosylation ligase (exosortase A-associated)
LIRSLFLTAVFLSFLGLGMAAPFVFTLGYAWVDTFRPQAVAFIILNQIPVALIMAIAAIGGYVAMDRRSPPRLTLAMALTLMMGCWITATMFWAEMPDQGWLKWDWAFKTVMFSAFIPLAIRSRVQIEAFAQTYVFSLAANFVPFGVKVMISGGGYGHNLGLEVGDSNLSEGGLLSTICLMAIPLALHLARHTQLLPRSRLVALGYAGLCVLALATALGTFERSALIGLVVMGAYMLMRSRHKLMFGLCLVAVSSVLLYMMSAGWQQRIATISDPTQETSALTRLLVWKWTFNYALAHPFGGGFQSYLIDRLEYPGGQVIFGRAFHSIYFEVLGEQGWVGLALFLGVAVSTFFGLRRLVKRVRGVPHLAWAADMSNALQTGLAVFMTAGAFVGIGFQPAFWYFIAMSVSLREYVRRAQQQQPVKEWRIRTAPPAPVPAPAAAPPPWRAKGQPGGARARAGLG